MVNFNFLKSCQNFSPKISVQKERCWLVFFPKSTIPSQQKCCCLLFLWTTSKGSKGSQYFLLQIAVLLFTNKASHLVCHFVCKLWKDLVHMIHLIQLVHTSSLSVPREDICWQRASILGTKKYSTRYLPLLLCQLWVEGTLVKWVGFVFTNLSPHQSTLIWAQQQKMMNRPTKLLDRSVLVDWFDEFEI